MCKIGEGDDHTGITCIIVPTPFEDFANLLNAIF